jgi:thymidylate synthase (FAD)
MKIINQRHEIIALPEQLLETIEKCGRACYKSEDKITPESAPKFVGMLRDRGHHAMIEFGDITVRFITNRGVTHELVRHRHCSFAQESTRYVRYDGGMEFIRPVWCSEGVLSGNITDPTIDLLENRWLYSMRKAEQDYRYLLNSGWRPEQARDVLPNAMKTEIVVKANIREWRHIFTLRTAKAAHPQMRALMLPLLAELKEKLPVVFDDLG